MTKTLEEIEYEVGTAIFISWSNSARHEFNRKQNHEMGRATFRKLYILNKYHSMINADEDMDYRLRQERHLE